MARTPRQKAYAVRKRGSGNGTSITESIRANEAEVVDVDLAVAAASNPFKAWLRDTQDALTEDFELPV